MKMKTKAWKCLIVVLCLTGLIRGPGAYAENTPVRSVDIALAKGGILIGQVVDTEGNSRKQADVVLKSGGKEIARCKTDDAGKFHVSGLRGGSIEVASMGTVGNCRVWAPGTAPPAAQPGLLVVAEGEVIRGQHGGRRVPGQSYGRGVRRQGSGLLAKMIEHPLVTAGAVGAAIAVPLAVSNDDSPSSP